MTYEHKQDKYKITLPQPFYFDKEYKQFHIPAKYVRLASIQQYRTNGEDIPWFAEI